MAPISFIKSTLLTKQGLQKPSYGKNHVDVYCRAVLLKDKKQEKMVEFQLFFFSCILYGKGVIFCEQYEKLDGQYFADFEEMKKL